jgi:hypothetical protein
LPAVWLVYSDVHNAMRELNNLELETVSGAAKPAPAPVVPTTILGVRLSKGDQRLLAAIILALRPRPKPAA